MRAANSSSTTTGSAAARYTYAEVGARRARLCRAPARARPRAKATKLSSGARTARNGSSRSGAACCAASSSCRSTTARRPIFSRASRASSTAQLVLIGQDVPPIAAPIDAPVWKLHEIDWRDDASTPPRRSRCRHARRRRRDHLHVGRDGRAEGRRHHASQRAGEHRAGRARGPEVPQVGHAVLPAPLPEPAAAQPHVRPGDGDVHPADAAGHRGVHARLQPGRDRRADQDAADSVLVSVPKILDVLRDHVAAASRRTARERPGRRARREALVAVPRASIGCSASSSGRSSSAPRRSSRSSRRSGASSGSSSSRATG